MRDSNLDIESQLFFPLPEHEGREGPDSGSLKIKPYPRIAGNLYCKWFKCCYRFLYRKWWGVFYWKL